MKKRANTNETEPHFDNRTEITVQRANSWLQKTCFIWHIFFRWCDKKRSIRQRHQVTRFHTAKDERIPYPMQYIWFVLMSSFFARSFGYFLWLWSFFLSVFFVLSDSSQSVFLIQLRNVMRIDRHSKTESFARCSMQFMHLYSQAHFALPARFLVCSIVAHWITRGRRRRTSTKNICVDIPLYTTHCYIWLCIDVMLSFRLSFLFYVSRFGFCVQNCS